MDAFGNKYTPIYHCASRWYSQTLSYSLSKEFKLKVLLPTLLGLPA